MHLVQNERTKLLANALDRASSACLTVGFLAPVAAAYYGPVGAMPSVAILISGCASWIAAALALHYGASGTLKLWSMNSIQIFALFVLPACIAAFGLFVGVQSRRVAGRRHLHPGE